MRHGKSWFGVLVLLAGLASPAAAQQFGVGGVGGNAFANGVGFGNGGFGNAGFGNGGFGNAGFGGGYYGYNSGYGLYRPAYPVPQTYNNVGGLANIIGTQTGKANSYRYPYNSYGPGIGGMRRRR